MAASVAQALFYQSDQLFIAPVESKVLDAVFHQSRTWPLARLGQTYCLPLQNSTLTVTVPDNYKTAALLRHNPASPADPGLPPAPESLHSLLNSFDTTSQGQYLDINLFETFKTNSVKHLFQIWEILLSNQSLLIMADNPQISSQAVLGAVSLISPLMY